MLLGAPAGLHLNVARAAGATLILDLGLCGGGAPAVVRLDVAHGAGGGAHDDGVGGCAAAEVAHALESSSLIPLIPNPYLSPEVKLWGRASGGASRCSARCRRRSA